MRRPKKTVTINLSDYLSAGTYNVKVKSKGTDIRDSADSNSVECVVAASGYTVNVTSNTGISLRMYDGQNSSGIDLGWLDANTTETYTITSGYLYAGGSVEYYKGSTKLSNPVQITENCSLTMANKSYY